MKSLFYLSLLIVFFASCQPGEAEKTEGDAPIEDAGDNSTADTLSNRESIDVAEGDCAFQMKAIQSMLDGKFSAVMGRNVCMEGGQAAYYWEVILYEQDEAVGGKEANVFKLAKEDFKMEIKVQGNSLIIMHDPIEDEETMKLREFMVYPEVNIYFRPYKNQAS